MWKVISCSLSPNTEADDVLEAIRVLLRPWIWRRGHSLLKVKKWFSQRYGTKHVILTNSGRSALFLLLKAFGITKGDEVIVQAFTCVAVPNSVIWSGATPVYADIDDRYNLDPKDLEKKITPRTRAVIVQHTLGFSAQIASIVKICTEHNILLLEDCAHSLGVTIGGKHAGTFGDAAIFSFGRDKVLSSVFGGAAIIQEKHENVARNLEDLAGRLEYPARTWIFRQLIHPISFAVILPFYTIGAGKVLLVALQKLSLLSFPVYPEEKRGHKPDVFPERYPNGLASLLLRQLKKLDRYKRTREETARWYQTQLNGLSSYTFPDVVQGDVPLRFPLMHAHPERIQKFARRRGILLGNWYHNTIDPRGVVFAAVSYTPGSCPIAETAAGQVLNLPTLLSSSKAMKVIRVLKHGVASQPV